MAPPLADCEKRLAACMTWRTAAAANDSCTPPSSSAIASAAIASASAVIASAIASAPLAAPLAGSFGPLDVCADARSGNEGTNPWLTSRLSTLHAAVSRTSAVKAAISSAAPDRSYTRGKKCQCVARVATPSRSS